MEKLTDEELGQLNTILTRIYGANIVSGWTLNEKTYQILERMLVNSEVCSRAMNFVPRPGLPTGTITKYVTREMRKVVLRHFSRDENEQYLVCLTASAAKHRMEFEMAGLGL